MSIEVEQIDEVRRLLEPTPVRERHVPSWFRRALLKVYGRSPYGSGGMSVLAHAKNRFDLKWVDHYGSTVIDGREYFVCEPYPYCCRFEHLAGIVEFCQKTGLEHRISANAWHYPGKTIRVLFWEPDDTRSPEAGPG